MMASSSCADLGWCDLFFYNDLHTFRRRCDWTVSFATEVADTETGTFDATIVNDVSFASAFATKNSKGKKKKQATPEIGLL